MMILRIMFIINTVSIVSIFVLLFIMYDAREKEIKREEEKEIEKERRKPCVAHKIHLDALQVELNSLRSNVIYDNDYRLKKVVRLDARIEKLMNKIDELERKIENKECS